MEAGVVLKMQGICMTFPGVKALEGVDLTLKKGEIRALMGENGAGKSTLIKCLTGVNKFEAGEIYLEGFDHPIVNKDTMDAQKKGISTVYQEVNLCPNLSVAENLYIGREPLTKLGTVNRKAMNRQAAALMKQLELDVDVTLISFDATHDGLQYTLDGKINCNVECNPIQAEVVKGVIEKMQAGEEFDKTTLVEDQAFVAPGIESEYATTMTDEVLAGRAY